ncbi:hypothetical protein AB7952_00225 [Streptomyces sp. PG2]
MLFGLSRKPLRHGELVDLIGGVSRKVLTRPCAGSRSTVWSSAVPRKPRPDRVRPHRPRPDPRRAPSRASTNWARTTARPSSTSRRRRRRRSRPLPATEGRPGRHVGDTAPPRTT